MVGTARPGSRRTDASPLKPLERATFWPGTQSSGGRWDGYWITVTTWPAATTVPERGAPGFAATSNWTVPLPVTLAPEVIVIHDVAVLAVHEHKGADTVTLTEREAPLAGTLTVVRLSVKVQLVPCSTVNVCPAIVRVPFLELPGLAATVTPTEPLPVPIDPDVTVIHESLLTAVQLQPLPAATLTVGATPPPAPTE